LCRKLKFYEFNYCNCTLAILDNQVWSDCATAFFTNCYSRFIDDFITNDIFTVIIQRPNIELFGFISDSGVILSLFIGFTFISLLEIIETLAELA
jgi:hypothetical protein